MLGPADASRGLGVSPGRGGGPFPCYPCYPLHAGRKCACSAGVLFCVGEIFAFDAVICYGVGARERESLPIFSSTPVTESVCALFARQPIACWATQERQHSPDAAAAVQLDVVIVRRFEVETFRLAKDYSKKKHAPIPLQIFGRNPFHVGRTHGCFARYASDIVGHDVGGAHDNTHGGGAECSAPELSETVRI